MARDAAGGTVVALTPCMRVPVAANPINGIKVLIVSRDDKTIDGTQRYLSRVGASAQSVTTLAEAVEGARTAQAVVLFADDYAKDSAIETLSELRKRKSAKVVIVVSDQVDSFASVGAGESTGALTLLRRPTWGWMLLDAIRSQLTSDEEHEP
jgi:DNA-binding response OmpR family regulator